MKLTKTLAAAMAVLLALGVMTAGASTANTTASSAASSTESKANTAASSKAASSTASKTAASSNSSSSEAVSNASGSSSAATSSTAANASDKKAEAATPKQPEATMPPPEIKAKSVIVCEASTGKILYESNSHEKLRPASVTKIMTELLTLEAIKSGKIKWTDTLTCSAHAASMGGSDIWLAPNEQMTVKDLFKAMSISSANDAAVVFAEKIGGSEPGFVTMMNQRAKALGMNDTHFVNANGLDADGHETSAYDVMLMSRELIKHKEIFDFCTVWMDSVRDGKTQLVNTNKMLRSYNGLNGLKTGSTGRAGYCVSSTALRDGMQLIAVTMGADSSPDRFSTAANLLNYGFGGWSLVKAKPVATDYTVRVQKGTQYTINAKCDELPSVLVAKGKESGVTQKVSVVSDVEAPVEKGQVLGQITLWQDGKNIGSAAIKAVAAVPKLNFGNAFKRLMQNI